MLVHLVSFKYKAGDSIVVGIDDKGEVAITHTAATVKKAKPVKDPKDSKETKAEPAGTAGGPSKAEPDS